MISSTALSQDLVLTGVVDGPLSGGVPKAIELCVLNDIADLSDYGVGAANNGGGSDGEEFTFPAGPVSAGTFLYVASEAVGFEAFFGFAPGYTSSAIPQCLWAAWNVGRWSGKGARCNLPKGPAGQRDGQP